MTSMVTCPIPPALLHEINGRCLDLLANAARAGSAVPLSLVDLLHDALLRTTPESRRRAAARHFFLIDLEFRNIPWWQAVSTYPEQTRRGAARRSFFPRRTAIPLTRATLMVTWQAIRCDVDAACLLLGMDPAVANIIVNLPITTLDQIAGRCHGHLQPRWTDRPAFWRGLLQAAERNDSEQLRALDAHGLRLLTSDLLSDAHSGRLRA